VRLRDIRKRLAGFLLAAALAGCGPKHASYVKVDNVALGRVVVYRNGVAFYERRATVTGGTLTVSVPRDRVDDFLKSLTVVDALSGKPLPVSIPRQQADDGNYLVMKLQLPTKVVEIAEATPIERTLDLSADVTLDMMKVYVDAPEGSPELKDSLKKLLAIHGKLVDLMEEQQSLNRRLRDYRERMDELHAQIVTLQAVKTGGELMTHLKAKMKDISERVQKATISMVDTEEKIMLTRVEFQDTLAELTLPEATKTATAASAPAAATIAPAAAKLKR
jgi:hypothetical protein